MFLSRVGIIIILFGHLIPLTVTVTLGIFLWLCLWYCVHCIFIDMHVFLVQQYSEDSDDDDDSDDRWPLPPRPPAGTDQSSMRTTGWPLPPPLPPSRLPVGTMRTLPPESAFEDNFESASFLPPSLSSPISHLSNGQPEEQHGL